MKIGYRTLEAPKKNKVLDVYYRRSLQNLYSAFVESCINELKKHYAVIKTHNAKRSVSKVGSTFNKIKSQQLDLFMDKSEKIIVKYVKRLSGSSKRDFKAKFARFLGGKRLAIKYNNARYDELLKIFVKRNTALISTLCQNTVNKIENIVYDAMSTGSGWEDITKNLYQQTAMGERHIKLIARDQTSKATEEINMFMQQSAGAEYFEWDSSHDERVREEHRKLNGKIFKYGDDPSRLPIIDKKGTRGYPATAINCRCTALAVFVEDGYEAVWDKSKESYVIKRIK